MDEGIDGGVERHVGGPSLGRRSLIKKAAAGGALTWVAPTLVASPAQAQGSSGMGPTTTTPPPAPVLWAAAGSNNGSQTRIQTSTDAITWTDRSIASITDADDLLWDGTRFIGPQGGRILSSSDGVSWSESAIVLTGGGGNSIAYNGSTYVIVGVNGSTLGGSWSSSNGSTWTQRLVNLPAGSLMGVASDNSGFVAVGFGGQVWTSGNGTSWTQQTSATAGILRGVVWAGSQWVAVGSGGTLVTSPDGVSWTSRSSSTSGDLHDVGWNGSRIVAVGDEVTTSTDGVNWSTVPVPGSGGNALRAVAYSFLGGYFTAVGGDAITARSFDGLTWVVTSTTLSVGLNTVAVDG